MENFKLPKEVLSFLERFTQAGFQIYVVGGAVRDLVAGFEVTDWDFTTNAEPEEIIKLFKKDKTFGEPFYDNKFGTVGIPVPTTNHQPPTIFEITTMRKEGDYQDFRRPVEVSWTDKIEEDLARRDFTINAMALNLKRFHLLRSDTPIIIDPFNGQNDLQDGIIRAVGEPTKRFQEDALRLMRAVRIAAQLNFEIEKETLAAIRQNAELIKEVASERIRDELFKLLASANPYIGIIKLREAGILQIILPELERCFGLQQAGPKHDRVYDIGEHSLLSLKYTPSGDPLVRLAALLHDVGKPDTAQTAPDGNVTFYNHDIVGGKIVLAIAKRFNLSKKQADKLYRLVRWHLFTVDENQTDSAIRRFIKNVGLENIDDLMAVRVGDRLGGGTQKAVSWRMEKFRQRIDQVLEKPFSITDLKVNGQDVMEILKIKPGPKIGEILQELFEEVLEDSSKNDREYLLGKVKQLSSPHGLTQADVYPH